MTTSVELTVYLHTPEHYLAFADAMCKLSKLGVTSQPTSPVLTPEPKTLPVPQGTDEPPVVEPETDGRSAEVKQIVEETKKRGPGRPKKTESASPAKAAAAPQPAPAPAPVMSHEECKAALKPLHQQKGDDVLLRCMKKFGGATRLSEVPADKRAELVKLMESA